MVSRLKEKIKKIKSYIQPFENDLILAVTIICVALVAFGLGRLSVLSESKIPITIENPGEANLGELSKSISSVDPMASSGNNQLFVASKSGAKYHYPWCSGAQRIKKENKIWFSSKEEAEKAGYTPAANCKGL